MNKKIEISKIRVKANQIFMTRRLATIQGLNKKEFRALKHGNTIEIDKLTFETNQDIFEEVK